MSGLVLQNLSVTRAGRTVLSDVSMCVAPGEFVGLIGPNGAGKTTLLRAALGLVPASGASNLATLPPRLRAKEAAFLPQEREIAWPVTVARLIALGRLPHLGAGTAPGHEDQSAIDAAVKALGLDDLLERPATELSGGERARALIARALAQDTPLILADEPTAGLDPAQQIALMETFSANANAGKGLLVSMHDLGLALRYCTRLILLSEGRLVADGSPDAVLNDENLAMVFGVGAFRASNESGQIFQPIPLKSL